MAPEAANLELAPADAVEYFRAEGLQLTALRTIRQMVDKAISTGMTFDEFKQLVGD